MDCAPPNPIFPLSRYVYFGDFRFYYGYGNTPPDDYLENGSGISEPSVLILGCGDIRSCLYTLWKNFGSSHGSRFNGVHFVLNDNSAAVLARDVLLLYLCLKMPNEKERMKEWLCAVWAIWFCHELLPEHDAVLNNALSSLLRYSSKSWSYKGNPLSALVKFTSPQVLREITQVWKMWRDKDVRGVKSVDDMNSARLAQQIKTKMKTSIDNGSIASGLFASAFGFIRTAEMKPDFYKIVKAEVLAYYNTGNGFIEELLSKACPKSSSTVNYTLYERSNGRFTMHYASLPFNCFHHSFQYSAKRLGEIKCPKLNLLVPDSCFETYPLLANSVQQFALWFQACARILGQSPNISFTFNCSDALQLCQELQSPGHLANMEVRNKFDLVYTSNLIDHLAPPNLVLSALPLLKSSGCLFTTTLLYKVIGETAEEYIHACFGFDSKLLPILFGIRCINHEGEQYSSIVSAQSAPWEYGSMETKQWPKLLVWEKVDMHPQKVPALVAEHIITTALCRSISLCATPLLVSPRGCRTINHLCIETAIKILQTYAAMLDACISACQFWTALCDRLLQEEALKPFLQALQTQCLLHGLHLHLTVDNSTCPLCLCVPIAEHIGQFTMELSLPLHGEITPNFMVFIHKSPLEDAQHLHMKAAKGMDVHIFDCLSANEKKGELNFYAPKRFAAEGYSVTLVGYFVGGIGAPLKKTSQEIILPFVNNHKELTGCRLSEITHYFQETVSPRDSMSSCFGSVVSHSGDGDYFETVLQLSDAMLSKLSSGSSVTTKQISPSEIEISCGDLKHSIRYPHPIEYDRLAVKISRKKQNATILSSRAAHNFEEECPLFQVNPENRLTLPPITVTQQSMKTYCGMQYTQKDRTILENCRRESTLMPPMVNLKESINILFQCCEEHFFHISLPVDGVHALVLVQNSVFDIERKTPALDLAYCLLEHSFVLKVVGKWQTIVPSKVAVRSIQMDENEYKLVKKVLKYFSDRTITKTVHNVKGRLQLLTKNQIDRYFTRAVVYPLYADPDFYDLDMDLLNLRKTDTPSANDRQDSSSRKGTANKRTTSSLKKCDNCGVQSSDLKKCASCGKVLYCSRDCQKKHWKEHKPNCLKSAESAEEATVAASLSKCDGCGGMFASLKKCPCHQVAYCSVTCQKKEWPKHKTVCTNRLPKH